MKLCKTSDAGRVVLVSAKRLRSKLNHAVEAINVKLAASKPALGLHSVLLSQTDLQLTTETCQRYPQAAGQGGSAAITFFSSL
jgi:hypothetical protein